MVCRRERKIKEEMIEAIDLLNVDGCVVKDERGIPLAFIREVDGVVSVRQLPACSLGTYLYILDYLSELGFELDSE